MFAKFTKILALSLVAMLALSGCNLVKVDKEKDDATIVAEFDGGTVTKGEANAEFAEVQAYYENYGYALEDAETIKSIKQELLDLLCQDKIVRAKAEAQGFTTLSEEDMAALKQEAQAAYDEVFEYYKMFFEGETEEETIKNTTEYLEQNSYTPEAAEQAKIEEMWQTKLADSVTQGITLTPEEVQAAYDGLVANDQETYANDAYSFEYAMATGEPVAWMPEGYRTVKHILIGFSDDEVVALSDKTMELEDVRYQIDELENGGDLEDVEGDADLHSVDDGHNHTEEELTAMQAAEDALVAEPEPEGLPDEGGAGEPEMSLEELKAEEARLTTELKALENQYAALYADKVAEVQQKIAAGENFGALIEEYCDDAGMLEEPGKTNGYYVSANSEMWEDVFTQTAMSLAKVGDVSQPVIGSAGVHIIRYEADVASGAVPLEQIQQIVEDSAMETAKTAAYDEAVAGWVAEANVKTYVDKM